MNIEAEKLELISQIATLKDQQLVNELMTLLEKKKEMPKARTPRTFGDDEPIFTYVAEDFNAPLEDFKEYME